MAGGAGNGRHRGKSVTGGHWPGREGPYSGLPTVAPPPRQPILKRMAVGGGIALAAGVLGMLNLDLVRQGSKTSQRPSAPIPAPSAALAADAAATAFNAPRGGACGIGGTVTQSDYAVAGEDTLRTQPRPDAPPVMIHLGSEQVAAPLEASAALRELCRTAGWSEVRILSLTDRELQGWVPRSKLRRVPTNPSGRRVYQARDFEWPGDSAGQTAAVVIIANRIMDQRPDCLALDTENLTLVGAAARGTFSLPCFVQGNLISFDFRAADAASGRSFVPVEPIDKLTAVDLCKQEILKRAAHPSTVAFPMIDYDFREGSGDGRTQLLMSFKAKNGFGLELEYDARCDFNGRAVTNVAASEAAGR